jgi:hypothetical protein
LYGAEALDFVIVEMVDTEDAAELFGVEQRYLDLEQPAYNRSLIAHGGPRVRFHTADTRAKISAKVRANPHTEEHTRKLVEHLRAVRYVPSPEEAEQWARKMALVNTGAKRSPEFCAGVSERNRGRVLSAETKAKIGAAHKGKGHPQTPETRAKIAAAHLGVPKKRKKTQET